MSDGDFFWDVERWVRNGCPSDYEILPVTMSDPDAFTKHGSEHAIDRWADDGGCPCP